MSSASSSRLRSLAIRWAYSHSRASDRHDRSTPPSQSEQGLTLLECLVAMIIITLTVVAITPPIMLATATRVQSRRGEQATQIAQGEIDRVRLMVERSDKLLNYTKEDLPADAGTTIKNVPAATANPTAGPLSSARSDCPAPPTPTSPASPSFNGRYPLASPKQLPITDLVQVDIDADCFPDYVMQVFRAEDQVSLDATAATPPFAFKVGVRVYKYFPDETFPTLATDRASFVATGGSVRDTDDKAKRKPLAVLYSTISRSGSSNTLCQVRQQITAEQGGGTDSCRLAPSPSPTTSP